MKNKPTILMTGAGGAAIPFLINSLKKYGYRVLCADMDPTAAGLYLSDRGFVIPKADDPSFIGAIKNICLTESVDVVIPLVDEELIAVSQLTIPGVTILVPRTEFIKTCLDKYKLIQELKRYHIPVPETKLGNETPGDIGYPCIVKPRSGRGSREVEILHSEEEYKAWLFRTCNQSDRFIFQQYLTGPEYTVSVVVWRDGQVQVVVPKKIIVKKGITRLAVTKHDSIIEQYCSNIQKYLKADGPFNVQLRCNENSGEPFLFEINPRYSTTVTLTIMAGIDELHGLIQQAINGSESYKFGEWKEGVILFRHYADTAISSEEFEQLSQKIFKIP